MGPWDYGVLEGRQVDRWLASRAGWRADVLRDRTPVILTVVVFLVLTSSDLTIDPEISY